MFDFISSAFFSIFSVYGLIGLAALGLYFVAMKIRSTPFSWILAFALGCGAAYATEFCVEIGWMMTFGNMPFQPWSVITYALIAFSCIWVSGNAKPSRWPLSIPCAVIAALALQHGIRFGETASTSAGIITAIVGVICWLIVPTEFKLESEAV